MPSRSAGPPKSDTTSESQIGRPRRDISCVTHYNLPMPFGRELGNRFPRRLAGLRSSSTVALRDA